MEMIQIMTAIMTMTAMTPTAAPALKIPAIAEHPLSNTASKNKLIGKIIFFIVL